MLPSTLKFIYFVELVRMHFPAKQPCTNDTVRNAPVQYCTAALHTVSFVQGCFAGKCRLLFSALWQLVWYTSVYCKYMSLSVCLMIQDFFFGRFYRVFKVCKSVHHHTFQINQPTRCNNFSSLLLDVYVQLKMFRASSRPSSGAQQLQ